MTPDEILSRLDWIASERLSKGVRPVARYDIILEVTAADSGLSYYKLEHSLGDDGCEYLVDIIAVTRDQAVAAIAERLGVR